jgi:hypothetical protein
LGIVEKNLGGIELSESSAMADLERSDGEEKGGTWEVELMGVLREKRLVGEQNESLV